MDISGPCHMPFHDGKPCDLYLVTTREHLFSCNRVTNYYFNSNGDAELYMSYLYQVEGLKNLKNIISSSRVPEWEKREHRVFRDSIDPSVLEEAVKNLKYTSEVILQKRGKK